MESVAKLVDCNNCKKFENVLDCKRCRGHRKHWLLVLPDTKYEVFTIRGIEEKIDKDTEIELD